MAVADGNQQRLYIRQALPAAMANCQEIFHDAQSTQLHRRGRPRSRRRPGTGCQRRSQCRGQQQDLQLEDDQRLCARLALLRAGPGQPDRLLQARGGNVRRAPEDPALRRRRVDSGAGGLRCGGQRHGRDERRQRLLLGRQDPRRTILHRRALRYEHPGHERLAVQRWRPQALARAVRASRPGADAHGQYRHADDRLVPPAPGERRQPQGLEDAHRRPGRQGLQRAGRDRTPAARWRDLPGAGAWGDRRRRIRRPLPGSPHGPAQGGQELLHHRLARADQRHRADHQQTGLGQPAGRPAGHRAGLRPGLQCRQLVMVRCGQRRGHAGPGEQPGRDRPTAAGRHHQAPA